MRTRIRLIVLLGIFVLTIAFAVVVFSSRLEAAKFGIMSFGGGQNIVVEIADTSAKMRRGLSGRTEIGDEYGMIFVYDNKLVRRFWMKDMNFSIDIFWITDGIVVGIEEDVPPPDDPSAVPGSYFSPVAVERVLEMRGGYARGYNIQVGRPVEFDLDLDGFPD